MHKMGVQSPAKLGRAVEWLGEIFRAASAADMGATGEHAVEKKSEGLALRLPEAAKFAQKYNTK
jgi:hypothetical protein